MNYKIIVITDRFDKNYKLAADEYIKRLGRFCKVGYKVLKCADGCQKSRKPKTYAVLVSPSGCSLTSEELAKKINGWAVHSKSEIEVIIGADAAGADFDEHIALSSMDMDDGLACAVFCEQIYRAYKILGNETYHR